MKIGPISIGHHFYAVRSPNVSGLKLSGHWIYSRVGSVSRFSLVGLVRKRAGQVVKWRAMDRTARCRES